jgi:hypothetical protein
MNRLDSLLNRIASFWGGPPPRLVNRANRLITKNNATWGNQHIQPLAQPIAVNHGSNRTAGSTAPRRGISSIGALHGGGGISPGGGGRGHR